MPEEAVQIEAPKPFNAAEFMAKRNGAPVPAKPEPAAQAKAEESPKPGQPAADKDEDESHGDRLPRSARREMNRLREEAAEARGRLAMLQELQAQGFTRAEAKAAVEAKPANVEPTRDQFASDAEFIQASAKFEAHKALKEANAKQTADAEMQELLKTANANTAKYEADAANFEDWEDAQEAMAAISLDGANTEMLVGLFAESDQRAGVSYYWAKHPDEFREFLKMSPKAQIRTFHRLEERVEQLYSKKAAADAGAAQAPPKPSAKDRTTPEKPAQGAQTAADRDVRKPRPSTEVAARGGTAPPEEPPIGSPAWMARRNQAQYAK